MRKRPKRRQLDVDKIARLARARRLQDPFHDLDTLRRHLCVWWSFKYTRPLKDPLLDQYTLEELIYEFYVHFYADPENDPLRARGAVVQDQADQDWARRMFKKVQAEQEAATKAPAPAAATPPPPAAAPPPDMPDLKTTFE